MQKKPNYRAAATVALGLLLSVTSATSALASCHELDVQAHRGAPGYPENSLESIVAALDNASYSSVEIDVYALADNTHVLHHDPIPGRVVNKVAPKPLRTLTQAEWAAARFVGSDLPPAFLTEALDAFVTYRHPHQKLNIEIKDDFDSGSQCSRMRSLHQQIGGVLPPGSWTYSTPHLGVMKCMASLQPQVYVGYVAMPSDDELVEQHSDIAAGAKDFLRERLGGGLADQLGRAARKAYQEVGKQHFLSAQRRQEIASYLRGRGGVHVGVGTVEANFDEIYALYRDGVAVYTYGVGGDHQHAAAIRSFRERGLAVSGAIIDGSPEAFCSMI